MAPRSYETPMRAESEMCPRFYIVRVAWISIFYAQFQQLPSRTGMKADYEWMTPSKGSIQRKRKRRKVDLVDNLALFRPGMTWHTLAPSWPTDGIPQIELWTLLHYPVEPITWKFYTTEISFLLESAFDSDIITTFDFIGGDSIHIYNYAKDPFLCLYWFGAFTVFNRLGFRTLHFLPWDRNHRRT